MDKRLFLATAAAAGAALPAWGAPRGGASPALLTVTGSIARTNRGPLDPALDQMMVKQKLAFEKAYAFDFAALAALPATTIKPTLEYDNKPHALRGPRLADVLKVVGVPEGAKLAMRAVDGYAPSIALAQRYADLLAGEDQIELPYAPENYRHVYQSYCVRLVGEQTQLAVMQSMANRRVATRRIIAIHQQAPFVQMYPDLSLPETEQATSRTLLLPMFVGLTESEQDQVVEALLEALRDSKTAEVGELVQRA